MTKLIRTLNTSTFDPAVDSLPLGQCLRFKLLLIHILESVNKRAFMVIEVRKC